MLYLNVWIINVWQHNSGLRYVCDSYFIGNSKWLMAPNINIKFIPIQSNAAIVYLIMHLQIGWDVIDFHRTNCVYHTHLLLLWKHIRCIILDVHFSQNSNYDLECFCFNCEFYAYSMSPQNTDPYDPNH